MRLFYLILAIFTLNQTLAQAAERPDPTLHSSIRVKGVHTIKDWPESTFSNNVYWNQVLREDPHPLDKACIEKQIQEIQKLFIPQPGQNFSQALKNQQINSGIEIQLQYGMDLNNGPSATLVQSYRFKALEWDMFRQRSLRVNVTLPHAKSGNANKAGTCIITSAELMSKAILNPNNTIGNYELAVLRLMDKLNATTTAEKQELMQDASLAQECGIALQTQAEISADKMKCLEDKMRQSFSRPMVRATTKVKQPASAPATGVSGSATNVEKSN